MKLKSQSIDVDLGFPKKYGVRQNNFKHKHHSCYIAGPYNGWLNNVYKNNTTPELEKDIEDKLVAKFGIPKAPINVETGTRRVADVTGCDYKLFKIFSADFFNYLNAGYVISVPIMVTSGFNDDWVNGREIIGGHGSGRGGHVIDMFKHQGKYYLLDSRINEPNPVRKMKAFRLKQPFYYFKDQDGKDNRCSVILPKK